MHHQKTYLFYGVLDCKKSGITYIKTILQRFICEFSFTR